ncbi:MAG: mucin-desulfating sulfatase, partial [Ruthenibacterium lactatiformans]
GLALNDYGDSIRFGASTAAEDEPDVSKVHFDLYLFELYTRGYLEAAGAALTDTEKEYLPWGAKLMTLECGIRFLTDYLQGDTYFKVSRARQNLERCRTQFKLVADMENVWDEMASIVKKYS